MTKKPKVESGIVLPRLNLQRIEILLVGDSPLICHRWSEKAKAQMLATQMKKAKQAKEAKDPQADYESSLYPHPDGGFAFPAVAFKACAVDAASFVDGLTKVTCRGSFHVEGEWVKINGEPSMREDMVRIGMGSADIRYRGEFKKWSAMVNISFNASAISAEQIIHLYDLAGFSCGLGEWRPQRDGPFGRFHVAREGEAP